MKAKKQFLNMNAMAKFKPLEQSILKKRQNSSRCVQHKRFDKVKHVMILPKYPKHMNKLPAKYSYNFFPKIEICIKFQK